VATPAGGLIDFRDTSWPVQAGYRLTKDRLCRQPVATVSRILMDGLASLRAIYFRAIVYISTMEPCGSAQPVRRPNAQCSAGTTSLRDVQANVRDAHGLPALSLRVSAGQGSHYNPGAAQQGCRSSRCAFGAAQHR
jgi:hypothetical protein